MVDDDPVCLKNANDLLSGEQMRVSSVRSGRELLLFLKNHAPDIILLDVLMPEMDGFETYKKLRKFEDTEGRRHVPVIFLTGDSDIEAENKGLSLGASDYIRKPINKDILLQRIWNTISSAEKIENLTEEVTIDHLTGFLNRAGGEKKLYDLCRSGKGILMVLDIDDFKLVNDLYGHDTGDRVLRLFADIARKNSRNGDLLCRIGGDEFLAFLKDSTDKKTADAFIGRLNDNLVKECRELLGDEMNLPIGVSAGCVLVSGEGGDYESLFSFADKALYQVKQNGKHGCRFFDFGLEEDDILDSSQIDKELFRMITICEERGRAASAMWVGQEAFTWIYRFIDRYARRHKTAVTRMLFILSTEEDRNHLSEAMEHFGAAIQRSIRKSDVLMQRKQNSFFLILPELSDENTDKVIDSIMNEWEKSEYFDSVRVDHSISSCDYGVKES